MVTWPELKLFGSHITLCLYQLLFQSGGSLSKCELCQLNSNTRLDWQEYTRNNGMSRFDHPRDTDEDIFDVIEDEGEKMDDDDDNDEDGGD